MTLPDQDVERLNGCILELNTCGGGPAFRARVLGILYRLVPAEHALYGLTEVQTRMTVAADTYPTALDFSRVAALFDRHFAQHPLDGAAEVLRIRAREEHVRIAGKGGPPPCGAVGFEEQLMLRLPTAGGYVEAFGLTRSATPFSSKDARLLRLFREHLRVAWARARVAVERHEQIATAWDLKPRQSAILAEVIRGLSNKEIAQALRCAESTVEYHLTCLFKKTGVTSRGALIARYWAQP
jgi:DNA-binding CsgD family transcriptional regulator